MLVDLVLVFLVCLCLRVFGFAEFRWQENPWHWLGCLAMVVFVLWLAKGTGWFVRPWNRG